MFWKKRASAFVVGMLLLSITACQPSTEKNTSQDTGKKTPADPTTEQAVTPSPEQTTPEPQPPKPVEPPKPTMPEVNLTDQTATTCLVKVDDLLPEGKLANRDGKVVELSSLLGPKLTVVCFWQGGDIYALEELKQLEKHVAGPYADKGVRVVAVNHKDTPQVVAEKIEMTGATFPSLLDPDGAYFAKVATEGLPRTYLVDDGGKILWFDTEYSRGTQRDLLQAIDYVLAQ